MSIALDRGSLLVDATGEETLASVEAALRRERLTLDVDASAHAMTVREWLEAGAPGARDVWLDPADHVLAGLEAILPSGKKLVVRPAPRRAVGPDLTALIVGCGGRYAKLVRAHLRVHPVEVERPKTAPFAHDRDPALTDGEKALLETLDAALAAL